MSATADVPTEVHAYLEAVRATLADLPAAERDDLLAEVESSLRDAAGETGSIGARLGSPEEFAAELRAAAGLHESDASARNRVDIRAAFAALAVDRRLVASRRALRELAPIWWAARGYIAAGALALAVHAHWSSRYPGLPRFHGAGLTVLVLVVAVAASLALGLASRTRAARAVLAVNVLCVLLAILVVHHAVEAQSPAVGGYTIVTVPFPGLAINGVPIKNIYPYSIDGKLLHDVLLYDGAGNPISVTSVTADPNRRVLRSTSNRPIYNSFPIRYYDPGTVRVSHPNAGPPVKTPHVLATK